MTCRPVALCGLLVLQLAACARRDDSRAAVATAVAAPAATANSIAPPMGPVLKPVAETEPVPHDADDPAIWVHPTDPSRSLILGTDKFAREGGLHVFGLDGKRRQTIAPLDRPNNVDIEYGVTFLSPGATPADAKTDIAILTERKRHRLRIFAIPADGGALVDLAPEGLPVLEGQTGEASEPMGVSLYKRPADGATFAIVAPKTGGTADYLWQYRLERQSPDRRITVRLVRRFGNFSRRGSADGEIGEIEAVVVDDELGYVYYSDERFGIRKWHADPDHADAARELAVFGKEGYAGDREGLAIYAPEPSPYANAGRPSGFLISSDQVEGATRVFLYPRAGANGNPHDHPVISVRQTTSDETDGLDVTARPLPGYPRGLLVMMNSTGRNFSIYRWDDLIPLVGGARP
jgi:3-phytase